MAERKPFSASWSMRRHSVSDRRHRAHSQPASQPAKGATTNVPLSAPGQVLHVSGGRSITLTREEAVDLLHVARNLADTLSDKLIAETVLTKG